MKVEQTLAFKALRSYIFKNASEVLICKVTI